MENYSLKKPEFVYIESSNFDNFPTGGTLSFSKQMLKVFGNRMALVGFVTDKTICGKWVIKEFNNVPYYFFGIQKINNREGKKPLIPARLTSYFYLKKYLKEIQSINVEKVFTRTPQFAIALSNSKFLNKCFCFAGTTNSVEISRYSILRKLAYKYEKKLFNSLKKFNVILASADKEAIKSLIQRSNSLLQIDNVYSFPTRFDDNIFKYKDKIICRNELNLDINSLILIVVGRLSWVKGWDLILDSFSDFHKKNKNSILLFVGDGEDKTKILSKVDKLNLNDKVFLLGKKRQEELALYINAADLFLVGSYYEGWSNAMIEALGCGKTIISTNISGASEMIEEGKNGYIITNRDHFLFSKKIEEALLIKNSIEYSLNLSIKYSLSTLAIDLENLWLNKNPL